MYSFDSLTLKYFFEENKNFIQGAIVQKIQLPTRYEIIFTIRNLDEAKNKKLYININPKYPHICFLDEKTQQKRDIEIPKNPPMFCMQLRKYLNGSKIKEFRHVQYERILEFYFDYFDEIGSLSNICLAVELMGKHSNVILYNAKTGIITGSIHNVSEDKSSVREIYGGIKYIYPPQKQKLDILKTGYATFYEFAFEKDTVKISDNFYYLNRALLNKIFDEYPDLEACYNHIKELVSGNKKEFLCAFWGKENSITNSVDNYFSEIIFSELIKTKKARLKKYILKDYKKLQKTLSFAPDTQKADKYKQNADLIMAYLYSITPGQKELVLGDIKIELDETKSPSDNAQKYYALYKKAKTAYEYELKRYNEAKTRFEYFETVIFNIDNAQNFSELNEIKDELRDEGLITDNKKRDKVLPAAPSKLEFEGWEIYLGKNNKQNDYLLNRVANSEDIWFHAYNCPSSHVILKIKNNKTPTKEVMEFCAKLTKENSKAKESNKASVIYTKRKNLKRPPDTPPGYVTYKNETEIVI